MAAIITVKVSNAIKADEYKIRITKRYLKKGLDTMEEKSMIVTKKEAQKLRDALNDMALK